jgi:PKD repeat protein
VGNTIVQWAGYDADPPQLRDVSIPGQATVGEGVRFSASSADVWPIGPPSFDFGDGGTATGGAVSHAYAAPGLYGVRVTATDSVGRTATSAGTILVKARNFFTIGKLKRNRRRGTATLEVSIPEPGTLVASTRGIRKATVKAAQGGTVKVPLKAAGKGLRKLNEKGSLRFRLKVAYSPVGGDTSTQERRLRLEKKLP